MALLQVNHYSDVLGTNTTITVILPNVNQWNKDYALPHQTLYLLGGGGCDHTYYQRNYPLEKYIEQYNLAIIMPSVITRYLYSDSRYGMKWWSYCSEELPQICKNMFHLSPNREDTFAAGGSGGGYAALKLGLRRPDIFGAVAGICPAALCQRFVDEMEAGWFERYVELKMIFGEEVPPEDDIFKLMETAATKDQKAKIYLCCGTEDKLFNINADLRTKALELGFDLTWDQRSGGHTWEYMGEMLPEIIKWLPLKPLWK